MAYLERFLQDFSFDSFSFVFEILIPSLLAIIFGGLIGLQRERHERPAGLRTHALVCLGATVFTLVSYLGFDTLGNIDPSRVAAGIVTGIGFIGAGVIFRQGILVKGVTTAASIWIAAAIGLALGTKLYYLAIFVTAFGLLILALLKNLEDRVIHAPYYTVRLTMSDDSEDLDHIKEMLKSISVSIKSISYETKPDTGESVYGFQVFSRMPDFSDRAISLVQEKKGISKISVD